ncbi:hypothetical protein [Liquorilactobacillus nagelii]|uniref:hypothetical protein n=1 Tax=Liquorilactobacillus nagelii TaxID=82688 RepID=UPI0039ECE842
MAEFKNISNNIKCLREANSLTQSELAKTLKTPKRLASMNVAVAILSLKCGNN